jgi:hypothetical protein
MIRATFVAIAALAFAAAASYGLGLAVGGSYFVGVPVGASKITAFSFGGVATPVDMTDGWPLKIGAVNFGLTSLVALTPSWGIEAGFEVHTGYKNKEATIKSTYVLSGREYRWEWLEPEDNVQWSLLDFYAGPRFSFRAGAKVRPFVAGGAIFGRSKYELNDREGGEAEVRASGPAFGLYGAAGGAVRLSNKLTLTFPVKFNVLFGAEYSYEGPLEGFSNDWKPGPYATAGAGLTYAVF